MPFVYYQTIDETESYSIAVRLRFWDSSFSKSTEVSIFATKYTDFTNVRN
jgi:hypothetical protein